MRTLLEVRCETEGHFQVGAVILRFLTILKKCQASSTFATLNSACLSMCQRYMRPLVEMMWTPRAFCRVFTVDSDILSSCDMNDEPALNLWREIRPLSTQGIPGSFSLEAENQGPSHIHIPQGKLLLRCLWKVG